VNHEHNLPLDDRGRLTYRLDLEYDGTNFSGWQYQPGERTVQGVLENAVVRLFPDSTRISAAGRTDAGVHATGQVAHFRSTGLREPGTVHKALNALLPADLCVIGVRMEDPAFHARFSAKWRGYSYKIARKPLAIGRAFCWQYCHRLNVAEMQSAARMILGDHCFLSFAHESEKERHYLSSVYHSEWQENDQYLIYCIEANRFLHGMVRFLVGTFVSIGRGKFGAEQIQTILRAQDVRLAGAKVPAQGLTLTVVGYENWSPSHPSK